jgi:hypothetical protein
MRPHIWRIQEESTPLIPGANAILDIQIAYTLPWVSYPPSTCRVSVFQHDEQVVVVLTETPNNRGVSVTNAVEHIAEMVMSLPLLQEKRPDEIVWIEHYLQRGKYGDIEETWDRVELKWEFREGNWHVTAGVDPRWQQLNRTEVSRLLGDI